MWFRKAVKRDLWFLKGDSLKKGPREDKAIVSSYTSMDVPPVVAGLTPPAGFSPVFNEITFKR